VVQNAPGRHVADEGAAIRVVAGASRARTMRRLRPPPRAGGGGYARSGRGPAAPLSRHARLRSRTRANGALVQWGRRVPEQPRAHRRGGDQPRDRVAERFDAGVVRSYGYIMLSVGGTALLASLIGMIPASSAEPPLRRVPTPSPRTRATLPSGASAAAKMPFARLRRRTR